MPLESISSMLATENTALLPTPIYISQKSLETIGNDESFIKSQRKTNLERARMLLYTSHFFAQFSEVSWQFGLVLFLSAVCCHKSLLLVSTYGLLSSLSSFVFGGVAGRYVDSTPRLRATRFFIWTENVSVVMATVCCYFLLSCDTFDVEQERIILNTTVLVLLLGVHFFGSLAAVLDRGFSVAIERDWIVVMSKMVCDGSYKSDKSFSSINDNGSDEFISESDEEGKRFGAIDEREWLSQTNVTMRQIDLACKVAAPSLTGFVAASVGESNKDLRVACMIIGLLNVLALFVEYECTKRIHDLVPDLSNKKQIVKNGGSNMGEYNDNQKCKDSETLFQKPDELPSPHSYQRTSKVATDTHSKYCNRILIPSEWHLYFSQSVAPAGFALSLL
jgi:iron-regulated transporter 1